MLRVGVWTLLFLILAAGSAVAAAEGTIELISKADPVADSDGNVPFSPVVTPDGRYVVFSSDAPNLVPGQVNGPPTVGVFLRDRIAGTTTLVSHAPGQPNVVTDSNGFFDVSDDSFVDLGISANGQYVVFASLATNLVPGQVETNHRWNVFLYDRITGINTLVSQASGQPAVTGDWSSFDPQISADGNWITFTSHAGNLVAGQVGPDSRSRTNVFLYHRPSGTLTLISHLSSSPVTTATGNALHSRLSADGSLVVFDSTATDLVSGMTSSAPSNVFSYATATSALSLVSHLNGAPLTGTGGKTPQISADGRFIAFQPFPAGGDLFLQDRTSGLTQLVSHGTEHFALSADGSVLAFTSAATNLVPGQVDTNGKADLFAWSRLSRATELVSHSRASQTTASANPLFLSDFSISADGRYIAFASGAGDLVTNQGASSEYNIFLYDRSSRHTVLASHVAGSLATTGNDASFGPVISEDGSAVLFTSFATDLGAGQNDSNSFLDLFAYDRHSSEVTPLSHRDPQVPMATPHGPSWPEALSADGKTILFTSLANGLVPGYADVPNTLDVFLRDRSTGRTVLLSQGKNGPPVNFGGPWPALSADGSFAAFGALDKGSGGAPLVSGLYLYDRAANATSLLNHAPGSATAHAGYATTPSLSADGRYVVFNCARCSVVPGMQAPVSQDQPDVFLYDRIQNVYSLVSHANGSPLQPADGGSNGGITPGGRFILFSSSASNLVAGLAPPPSQSSNLYLFDRTTGTTTLVSHAAGNGSLPTNGSSDGAKISADGRWIAFTSTATGLVAGQQAVAGRLFSLFLYDRTTGATVLVDHAASSPQTPANGNLELWSMSDDGRWIGFGSEATDLIAGGSDTNANSDVFLYDRDSATTTLISHAEGAPNTADDNGGFFSQLSVDGSRIAFQSPAPSFFRSGPPIHLILQDRATGARTDAGETYPRSFISPLTIPINLSPQMSANGHQIAFTSFSPLVTGDFNDDWDAYLFDDSGSTGPPPPPPPPAFPCTALDAPGLRSNVRTVFPLAGCGVPATARQVTVKVTASAATGKGTVQLYPGNVTRKPGTLAFQRGQTKAATFTLPPATNGAGTLAIVPTVAGHGTVHIVIEVEGFTP